MLSSGTYLVAIELDKLNVAPQVKLNATNNLNEAILTTIAG
jgi:hypothetical protein